MNNKYFNLYEQLPDPDIVTASYTALLNIAQLDLCVLPSDHFESCFFFKLTHIVSRLSHIISCC